MRQAENRPSDMLARRRVIARKPLITMHKSARLRPGLDLVRRTSVWTEKEKLSAIKSTTEPLAPVRRSDDGLDR